MKRILISGYYGFGNSGDDALLLSIISDFRKKGLADRITVLSANPSETKKTYGVHAINRLNPFALIFNFLSCRLFISGGGTLIQDGTSTKSLLYYLYLIKLATMLRKKVMLYANGIGPIIKQSNKEKCRKILNKVDCITLRDKKSLGVLNELGISKPEIKLTADPVFLLAPSGDVSDITQRLEGKFICVSVRKTKNMSDTFEDSVAAALDKICDKYSVKAVFLPLQKADKEFCNIISGKMKNEAMTVSRRLVPGEIMELVSQSAMCIGMRLHMLIYAAATAVPLVGIVYDPKVSGFMEYAGQKLFIDSDKLTQDGLLFLADCCMSDNDTIRNELVTVKDKLSQLARENSEIAVKLYKRS